MLLRNRSFVLLMVGEVIAGAGLWISILANLQFMQHLVPSDFLKAMILMSGMAVSILFAPKAGVMIDAISKQKILIAASLVRCLSPLAMLPALAFDSIGWMIVSLIIMQLTAVFYFPTIQSAIPAIIPSGELLRANSVYLNIVTLARIGGTAVGGVLIVAMELYTLYLFSLMAYALLAAITFSLRIPEQKKASGHGSGGSEFREVFGLIRKEPAVLVGLINTGMITLFLGGFNLLVLNFSELQQRPELMGWIYAMEGTSILLAGPLTKRWIGRRNLVTASTSLVFLFALTQFGLSFAGNLYMVLGSFAVFGATVAFFFPVTTTLFQKRLPEETQGRFFSFKGMCERLGFLVAMATTGAFLDLVGISGYMIILGMLTLLSAAVTLLYGNRHKLDVRQDEPGVNSAA